MSNKMQRFGEANTLIRLAIPMIISQGAFALMIFTDRYFMAQISPLHMAAALGGGVSSFLCLSFFVGLVAYGNALVAQYFGAGNYEKCPKVISAAYMITLFSLPIIWIMGYASTYLFTWMGHSPAQIALETDYLFVLQLGAGFALAKIALACFFAGTGRTQIVMIADTLGVLINIPLSYLLIHGLLGLPKLGIVGAGLGTLLSNLIVIGIYAIPYFSQRNRNKYSINKSFVVDKNIFKRYLRLGIPSGAELFMNMAAFNLFLLMFQSFGVVEGASAAIIFNWDILSFVPISGMAIAVVSLTGRKLGANDISAIESVSRAGFLIALGYASLLALLFYYFQEPMINLFLTNTAPDQAKAIFDLSKFMMIGLISYLLADAIVQIAGAVLRGVGDTKWLMITSISIHWLMLFAQIVVIKVFNLSSKIAWLVFVVMILALAIIYLLRLAQKKWLEDDFRHKILQES